MVKHLLKKHLPKSHTFHEHKYLKHFGELLHEPNLWHLKRISIANAVSVGLFCAMVPIPFQMVLAAALAILFRVNLPVSVILVWITNPITIPPIFYGAYKLGAWVFNFKPKPLDISLSWEWLTSQLGQIWQPLLLGSLICGIILAIIGNILTRVIWKFLVSRRWKKRTSNR